MIIKLLHGYKVPLYGDGLYVRDWLFVEDHCRAIELVLNKGKIGETYCVGGQTEEINNLQVTQKILKLLNKDDSFINHVKDRPGHDRRYSVDWSKIHNQLDWSPKYDFDTWLAKTVMWYKNNTNWWLPLINRAESIYQR